MHHVTPLRVRATALEAAIALRVLGENRGERLLVRRVDVGLARHRMRLRARGVS